MLTCPAPWLPSQSVLHYTYAAHDAEQEIHVQAKIHRTVFWDLQNRSCNVSLRNYFCCHYHRVNTLIQAPTVQHPAEQSFAPSPFPSSTQPSFSTSLRQTHIPLSKAFFGWWAGREFDHCHRWDMATLMPGHWGRMVQTASVACQASHAPRTHLCSLSLSLSPCACSCPGLGNTRQHLVLPAVHATSFWSPSGKRGQVRTSCKPDLPHWLPGEMC